MHAPAASCFRSQGAPCGFRASALRLGEKSCRVCRVRYSIAYRLGKINRLHASKEFPVGDAMFGRTHSGGFPTAKGKIDCSVGRGTVDLENAGTRGPQKI